ncbi:MAG: hypothetical protein R3F60_29655 [bacterium]
MAADARGQIENALTAVAALRVAGDRADAEPGFAARLDAAVAALVAATADAESAEAVIAAGAAFEGALRGEADSALAAELATVIDLRPAAEAIIEAAVEAATDSMAGAEAMLAAAVRADGAAGAEGAADGSLRAFATFDAAANGIADLPGLAGIPAEHLDLLVSILARASAGLYAGRL